MKRLKIVVATDLPYNRCPPFIKAHVDMLPFDVAHVYGAPIPLWREGEGSIKAALRRGRVALERARRAVKHESGWEQSSVRMLATWLRKERVDVVLAEYGYVGVSVYQSCEMAGVPLIVHFHGRDAHAHEYEEKGTYPSMFEYADYVIGVSKEMCKRLADLGAKRVVYNPCGASKMFLARQASPAKYKQFVAVGRFVNKKCPVATILAFARALKVDPDISLAFIGDGPLLESCKCLVSGLSLERKVHFYGNLNHDKVLEIMAESRCFVQHSVTAGDGDKEGSPVSVSEAQAVGLPVIATRHAGIPDVVADGKTGLLVDEFDIQKMAEFMIDIAKDDERAMMLGHAGRERVAGEFTLECSLNRLAGIVEGTAHHYESL